MTAPVPAQAVAPPVVVFDRVTKTYESRFAIEISFVVEDVPKQWSS
jgi:hypothetical protein